MTLLKPPGLERSCSSHILYIFNLKLNDIFFVISIGIWEDILKGVVGVPLHLYSIWSKTLRSTHNHIRINVFLLYTTTLRSQVHSTCFTINDIINVIDNVHASMVYFLITFVTLCQIHRWSFPGGRWKSGHFRVELIAMVWVHYIRQTNNGNYWMDTLSVTLSPMKVKKHYIICFIFWWLDQIKGQTIINECKAMFHHNKPSVVSSRWPELHVPNIPPRHLPSLFHPPPSGLYGHHYQNSLQLCLLLNGFGHLMLKVSR